MFPNSSFGGGSSDPARSSPFGRPATDQSSPFGNFNAQPATATAINSNVKLSLQSSTNTTTKHNLKGPALGQASNINTTSSTELNCSTRVRAQQSIQQSTRSRQRTTATTTNDVFGSSGNPSFSGNKSATGTAIDLNVKLSLQSLTDTMTQHNQITNIQIIVQNQIVGKEDKSKAFEELRIKDNQAALKESAQQQQRQQTTGLFDEPTAGFGFGNASTSTRKTASVFKFNSTISSSNLFENTQQNKGFGTTPGTSLFGNTNTAQQPQSTFGNVNNNQPSTLFGTQQPQNQSVDLFGQQFKSGFNTTPNNGFSLNQSATPNTKTSSFGASCTTPAFGQASIPTGFGFGTSGTGLSWGTRAQSIQQSTSFRQTNTATTSNVFGTAGNTSFLGNKPTTGTAIVKFSPLLSTDTMMKNNQTTNIQTRHQCITSMKKYKDKSFEELRLEDYQAGLKGPAQQTQQQQTTSLLDEPTAGFGFGNASTSTRKTASVFKFNSTTSSSNLFENTQQNKGFGTTPGTSLFGNTNTAQQPQSTFGNVNNNQPSTLFGTQQPQNQSIDLFGQQFKSGFNTTPNNGFILNQTATPSTNTGLFGAKPTTTPGFGASFGQQQALSFGTPKNTTQSLFNTSSTFSKPAQTGFSFNSTPASGTTALGTNTGLTSGLFGQNKSLFSGTTTQFVNTSTLGISGLMKNGNHNNQIPQNSSSTVVHQQISASSRTIKIRRRRMAKDVTPSQLSKKSSSDDIEDGDPS